MTEILISLVLYVIAGFLVGIPLYELWECPGYRPDWMNRLVEWWKSQH